MGRRTIPPCRMLAIARVSSVLPELEDLEVALAWAVANGFVVNEEEVVVLLFGMKMEDEDVAVVDDAVVVEFVTSPSAI